MSARGDLLQNVLLKCSQPILSMKERGLKIIWFWRGGIFSSRALSWSSTLHKCLSPHHRDCKLPFKKPERLRTNSPNAQTQWPLNSLPIYLSSSSLHLAHKSQLSALLFLCHKRETKFHWAEDLVGAKVRKQGSSAKQDSAWPPPKSISLLQMRNKEVDI